MKYLITLLLIPMQLFSCPNCIMQDFFNKAYEAQEKLSEEVFMKPLPIEMKPYYALGSSQAYYECAEIIKHFMEGWDEMKEMLEKCPKSD